MKTPTETNRRAAKQLWEKLSVGSAFSIPHETAILLRIGTVIVLPDRMHFHDSHDWCMFLVKKCNGEQKRELCRILRDKYSIHFIDAAPLQITLAALTVLEDNEEKGDSK